MKAKKTLVWLRNNLRLHDNEVLYKACQQSTQVYPVFCIDPRWFEETTIGLPKTSPVRTQFLLEALQDLRNQLEEIGATLIVRQGKPEEVLPTLTTLLGASSVYTSQEVTAEEVAVEEELERKLLAKGISLETIWDSTLYHLNDLPFPVNRLPDIFTEFRKAVEKNSQVRSTVPTIEQLSSVTDVSAGNIPTLQDLHPHTLPVQAHEPVLDFKGGEKAGLQRLHNYIWKQDMLKKYKETRNGLLGANYSSKFSPWLSLGCLSPRKIYEEVKQYEKERVKNSSTYWLIFELIWRDYFRFVAKKYGAKIFQFTGIKETELDLQDHEGLFEKWTQGNTGIPFIDANMRELNETGFMSNRGRQNVASFLVKDLKVNWVWGAMYFEAKLIDYDPCSNWGNWNYVAGVGNDPRENRYFNILSQAKRYDYQGEYVKHWIEALEEVPANKVHTVGELTQEEQRQYNVQLGVDYPNPLVDFERWLSK